MDPFAFLACLRSTDERDRVSTRGWRVIILISINWEHGERVIKLTPSRTLAAQVHHQVSGAELQPVVVVALPR